MFEDAPTSEPYMISPATHASNVIDKTCLSGHRILFRQALREKSYFAWAEDDV